MIIFSYDVESTGLDFVKDRVIEVGAILYSTTQRKCVESQGFLVKTDVAISEEITKLTGITNSAVNRFGYDSSGALETVIELMEAADAVAGHNIVRFDKRMTQAWAEREQMQLPEKLFIDTYTDLPNAVPGKLTLMAAEAGFLNLFPHSALSDTQTVLKLIEGYDIDKIVERAMSPNVVVQAMVTYATNALAKKERFRWYSEKKQWWRMCKEIDLETFTKDLQFDVRIYRENIQEYLDL